MRVSKGLFIALIVLNVITLGMLIADRTGFHGASRLADSIGFQKAAEAQEIQTAFGEYVMYASIMESELGTMWVIDTRTKRMACYRYNRNNDAMVHFQTRDLRIDMAIVGRPPGYGR